MYITNQPIIKIWKKKKRSWNKNGFSKEQKIKIARNNWYLIIRISYLIDAKIIMTCFRHEAAHNQNMKPYLNKSFFPNTKENKSYLHLDNRCLIFQHLTATYYIGNLIEKQEPNIIFRFQSDVKNLNKKMKYFTKCSLCKTNETQNDFLTKIIFQGASERVYYISRRFFAFSQRSPTDLFR